jgi:hypothetical protein
VLKGWNGSRPHLPLHAASHVVRSQRVAAPGPLPRGCWVDAQGFDELLQAINAAWLTCGPACLAAMCCTCALAWGLVGLYAGLSQGSACCRGSLEGGCVAGSRFPIACSAQVSWPEALNRLTWAHLISMLADESLSHASMWQQCNEVAVDTAALHLPL